MSSSGLQTERDLMEVVPVYILAGGRSSRFGSDKARALLDGKPLIVRLAEQLAPVAQSITVVADVADKYTDLGLDTIADLIPGHGPLSGLHAAIEHERACGTGSGSGSPRPFKGVGVPLRLAACGASFASHKPQATSRNWLLLCSCDLVEVRPTWAPTLLAAATDAARAVAFRGRRWEPLPALYHVDLRYIVSERLKCGTVKMADLLDAVEHRAIPLPDDWPAVFQVNTPDDLQRAGGKAITA